MKINEVIFDEIVRGYFAWISKEPGYMIRRRILRYMRSCRKLEK